MSALEPGTTEPAAAPFPTGWVRLTAGAGHDHWTDDGQCTCCGLKVPGNAVWLSPVVANPNLYRENGRYAAVRECPRCRNSVVKTNFSIPFEIGQQVVSRTQGMTLYGKVVRFFVSDQGEPHLDLDRFWLREPTDFYQAERRREEGVHHWYRAVSECQLYRSKPNRKKEPPVPTKTPAKSAPVAAVDFKKLAEETRAKMQAKAGAGKTALKSRRKAESSEVPDTVSQISAPDLEPVEVVLTASGARGKDGWLELDGTLHWVDGDTCVCGLQVMPGVYCLDSVQKYGWASRAPITCFECRATIEASQPPLESGQVLETDFSLPVPVPEQITAPEPNSEVPVATLQRPEERGLDFLPIGTLIKFARTLPDDSVVQAEGTIMNYAWNDSATARTGYLVAASGDEDYNLNWQFVGVGNDELQRRESLVAEAESPEGSDTSPLPTSGPELPGTPRLLTAPGLIPGTLGLVQVPLSQLVKSPCNVRRHYDQQAIEELASSLEKQGQLENLTGRWNAEGQVEAVAGETRRRAFLHLLERGSIQSDHPVLVYVRDLSDVQAIGASATENMQRRSMTSLEECEAMLRLKQAGQSEDDIALTFGYKTAQPVHDRVLVATNLFPKGRDLLDAGEISFAQAAVIARASGESLQKSMLETAKGGGHWSSAKALSEQLTRGQFLLEYAKFDVEQSGLEVKQDMYGLFEPFLPDKAKALNAQIAWAQAECERLGVTGKRAFYRVETGESAYFRPSSFRHLDYGDAKDADAGTVYYISTASGKLSVEKNVKLKKGSVTPAASSQDSKPAQREFSDPFYTAVHQARADAARSAILGQPHYSLALTVMGLILGNGHQTDHRGRVNVAEVNGTPDSRDKAELPEALASALLALQQAIQSTVTGKALPAVDRLERQGNRPDPEKLLRLLVSKTTEELLGYLNTLTALTAYDWSSYFPRSKAGKEYDYLASLTGANTVLAQRFTLTDEWLKRYSRHELAALADEAGLGRQIVEDAKTLKDARARILEHAARLHDQGFVPSHLRFAEVVK